MIASAPKPSILLLGTRGIPAKHGGFETFVERLAPYLASRGWSVSVYCQEEGEDPIWTSEYRGVNLIHIPVRGIGTRSTVVFDWICMKDALTRQGLLFSFGYPTGVFAVLPRLYRRRHVINMDGIEWKRTQFGVIGRASNYINERAAALLGNRLVADHPRIADHLATRARRRKITTIAYGADRIDHADVSLLKPYRIEPDKYALLVARPEPDNSILELVSAFSYRSRNRHLVVLGNFEKNNSYHASVLRAASKEVLFLGAIYDQPVVQALRKYARFYVHGHRVGGTNPSLVEALGAGSAVLAHDNEFNRWVASAAGVYFRTEDEAEKIITNLFSDSTLIKNLRAAASARFEPSLTWPFILEQYELMLLEEARIDKARL